MKNNASRYSGVCPICGQEYHGVPALSRVDNETLICPTCGIRQALESIGVVDRNDQDRIMRAARNETHLTE